MDTQRLALVLSITIPKARDLFALRHTLGNTSPDEWRLYCVIIVLLESFQHHLQEEH